MKNKISVIVPVYNVQDYLHRCVDSIINQTHQNLEIILVNDGSRDDSGKICDAYALKDKRVIVIHKKNEGSSCARNAGLEVATGNYISFVDSDDYIDKSMLELMFNRMLESNLDIVEIKPKSNRTKLNSDDSFEIQNKVSAIKRVIESTRFAVWCRLYKTSLVSDLRFIPNIIHQDVFFTIDVLNRIDRLGFLNSNLYNYNTDNESIIRSTYSLEKITIGIRATEYIKNNVPRHPELQKALNNYINHYYTDHYFLLSRNVALDPHKIFRKKLKNAVKSSINLKNYSLRSIMVVVLPYKLMEYISTSYKALTSS